MERLRVVGLSERLGDAADVCVGLEFLHGCGEFRVGEVFEALEQYLDQHRDELHRRGPQHVRVSMVRAVSEAGQPKWKAQGQALVPAV
jgi:hypothetical protein